MSLIVLKITGIRNKEAGTPYASEGNKFKIIVLNDNNFIWSQSHTLFLIISAI